MKRLLTFPQAHSLGAQDRQAQQLHGAQAAVARSHSVRTVPYVG